MRHNLRAALHPAQRQPQLDRKLLLLLGLALLFILLFLTIEVNGHWDFALPRRGRKVVAMLLVGYAIAYSSVAFQTVTNNRILTPSIIGFDSLYLLIQTWPTNLCRPTVINICCLPPPSSALWLWLVVNCWSSASLHFRPA